MNNNIRTIALTVGAPILALIATMFLFTGRGNLVAAGYKFYVPIFFVLCAFRPKIGLPLCILLAVVGDTVKRLMLYDITIQETDIALVLLLVPAGIGGLIVYALFDLFRNWNATPLSVKLVLAISTLLAMLSFLTTLAGGGGLRGFGAVVNSSLYLVFMGTIPILLRNKEDIIKTLRTVVIVFIPVALYGIYQGIAGFAEFEIAYLESGLTIEGRQLEEETDRVMSTLGTAASLSTVTGCLAGLSFSFIALNQGMRLTFPRYVGKVLLGILFSICIFYTYTRVGWVCLSVAFGTVFVLRRKSLTLLSMFSVIATVVFIYSKADDWWQQDLLRELQEQALADADADSASIDQTLKLVTWNARLESMSHFSNKSELWTPFGLKAAGKLDVKEGLWIHDPLTEILVTKGYVVLFAMIVIVIMVVCLFLRFYWRLPRGEEERLLRYLVAGGLGTAAAGASHGAALLVFPTNLVWSLFFGSALSTGLICMRNRKRAELEHSEQSREQQVT